MTYVMPPLLENLQETLSELPWPTQIVKAGSDLLLHHGLLLVVFVCSSILACGALLRSSLGRFYVDRLWLRLPILGPLTTKQNVSRIALILSTLLESGITLADALELAAKSTRNRVLKRALESCRESLLAGGNLAVSLHHSGVIPPLAIQVITVGQESGRLDELLARLAADYDRQVASASGRLASTLEPALILLLAAMVGFVLLAIVLPILEAGNVAM